MGLLQGWFYSLQQYYLCADMKKLPLIALLATLHMAACNEPATLEEKIEAALWENPSQILATAGITEALVFDTIHVTKVDELTEAHLTAMRAEREEVHLKTLNRGLTSKHNRVDAQLALGSEGDTALIAKTRREIKAVENLVVIHQHSLDSLTTLMQGYIDATEVKYYKAATRLVISDGSTQRTIDAQIMLTPQLVVVKASDI